MKTKSFKDYLEKRLDKKEIAQIKKQAEREVRIFKSFQKMLADMTNEYMKKKIFVVKNNTELNMVFKMFESKDI